VTNYVTNAFPPSFISSGNGDPLAPQAAALARKLEHLGVRVDERARVIMQGHAADNIFAAGEIMAGNILGRGYIAGVGMTIGSVFGDIAGTEAATEAARLRGSAASVRQAL